MYDPLECEGQRRTKKRAKKEEIGYGGKRYTYYEDRSDNSMSDDLEEAGMDEIEEEEFISGVIAD